LFVSNWSPHWPLGKRRIGPVIGVGMLKGVVSARVGSLQERPSSSEKARKMRESRSPSVWSLKKGSDGSEASTQ